MHKPKASPSAGDRPAVGGALEVDGHRRGAVEEADALRLDADPSGAVPRERCPERALEHLAKLVRVGDARAEDRLEVVVADKEVVPHGHPRQAVGEPHVDVHRPRVLIEPDQSPHVVGHAVLAHRSGVPLRHLHHGLPEGALAAVFLEPEVDRVGDLRVDLPRMLAAPHARA